MLVDAQRCYQIKDFDQANILFQQILANDPENINALNGLSLIAIELGMLDTAKELLQTALRLNGQHPVIIKNLALVYTRLECIDDAIALYERMLRVDMKQVGVHGELARLYLFKGDVENALGNYKQAFRLDPSDPRNIHGLLQLDVKTVSEEDISRVKKQLNTSSLSLKDFRSFYFAMGYYYDKCGRYDQAFESYTAANADSEIDNKISYDAAAQEARVTRLEKVFTAELFEKYTATESNDSKCPVFIVGMPRSGSTLVEQMLATDKQVHAAGELNSIEKISKTLPLLSGGVHTYPGLLKNIDPEIIRQLADTHEVLLKQLAADGETMVTDKMPANFLHLGLIALMFPNASIVLCQRHPLDVCLSCYFQNFAGSHPYAADLHDMAHYYQQYQRLMNHWLKVLPINIHVVQYEALVQQPDKVSQSLMNYLGLEWNESYRSFHESGESVDTASVAQVRKPLYQSSLQRWRNYENNIKHLVEFFETELSTDQLKSSVPLRNMNESGGMSMSATI